MRRLLLSFLFCSSSAVAAPVMNTPPPQPTLTASSEIELFKLDEEVVIEGKSIKAQPSAMASALMDRLIPPRKIDGPDPEYTQQAFDRGVEGSMSVECIIGADGRVRNCKAVKSLPFMANAVIAALEARTYRPAALDGKPIDVDYTFRLHFKLPQ
jgi:TonB family protein